MTLEPVSLIGIAAAVVLYMGLGFAWYSPFILGRPWMKLMGYTSDSLKKAQQEMGTLYLLSLLASIVMAYILAQVFKWLSPATLTAAFGLSFLIWLGFVAPVQFTDMLFGKRSFKLYAITTCYQLVGMLLMGAALYYLG